MYLCGHVHEPEGGRCGSPAGKSGWMSRALNHRDERYDTEEGDVIDTMLWMQEHDLAVLGSLARGEMRDELSCSGGATGTL